MSSEGEHRSDKMLQKAAIWWQYFEKQGAARPPTQTAAVISVDKPFLMISKSAFLCFQMPFIVLR